MLLSKSRRGYYYIWYKDERGRRRRILTRCRLKSDALKALMDFNALTGRRGTSVMLSQFIEDFPLYATATQSAATVDMYDRTLRLFMDKV